MKFLKNKIFAFKNYVRIMSQISIFKFFWLWIKKSIDMIFIMTKKSATRMFYNHRYCHNQFDLPWGHWCIWTKNNGLYGYDQFESFLSKLYENISYDLISGADFRTVQYWITLIQSVHNDSLKTFQNLNEKWWPTGFSYWIWRVQTLR